MTVEINFFGFPGPLHNLIESGNKTAYPKNTAIEWLDILITLKDLGLNIAILPPHERPHIPTLKFLGFTGSDSDVIAKSRRDAPEILAAATSSSFIWNANAATSTPAVDSLDNRIHITPANLSGNFSRAIESTFTTKVLKNLFSDKVNFSVHEPLPRGEFFEDEGNANHLGFCDHLGGLGVHLLAFSKYAFKKNAIEPKKHRSLQSYESQMINARKHLLYKDRVIFAQESSQAIDAGAIHINKVALSDKNLMIYHESSFVSTPTIIDELKKMVEKNCRTNLIAIEVPRNKVSLEESIGSSLFESIYIKNNKGGYLICPEACKHIPSVADLLSEIRTDPGNPINDIHYINISGTLQMKGGPSSLGFKVTFSNEQLKNFKQGVLFTNTLHERLRDCVNKFYRDEVKFQDLSDPKLLEQNHKALDEISKILDLGPIYDFQK